MQVLARAEFKLKYAGSMLGYLWSLAKPMAYFTVLLGRLRQSLFKEGIDHYPLYLLIGIVLNTFLVDAVSLTLPSLVSNGPTIRRISFAPVVIPLSTSLAAAMTFLVNCVVVGVFLAVGGIVPQPEWVLVLPLLVEMYVFVFALGLIALDAVRPLPRRRADLGGDGDAALLLGADHVPDHAAAGVGAAVVSLNPVRAGDAGPSHGAARRERHRRRRRPARRRPAAFRC